MSKNMNKNNQKSLNEIASSLSIADLEKILAAKKKEQHPGNSEPWENRAQPCATVGEPWATVGEPKPTVLLRLPTVAAFSVEIFNRRRTVRLRIPREYLSDTLRLINIFSARSVSVMHVHIATQCKLLAHA